MTHLRQGFGGQAHPDRIGKRSLLRRGCGYRMRSFRAVLAVKEALT